MLGTFFLLVFVILVLAKPKSTGTNDSVPHIKFSAVPSVNNVRILGDVVEGNTVKGAGDYFGGREGPSKFEWLRENGDTGSVSLALFLSHCNIYRSTMAALLIS